MGKMKEYIIKNKKIVIPVAIMIILLFIGSVYLVVQANSNSGNLASKQEIKETEKEEKKDLVDYVNGLKDLTVEVNSKKVDFLKDVTYDKDVVKEVTVDASEVDLAKEGKYDLTYSIIPIETTNSKKTVIKTLTVEVTSKEKEQKDSKAKKESKGNTSNQKEEATSHQKNSDISNNFKSQNTNSSDNSGGSSKQNTNSNSGNTNSNKTKPVKPEEPKHEHKFVYVPAQTHTEYETVTHTEQIPKYKTIGWYECNHCHEHFDNDVDAIGHCVTICGCNYSYYTDYVEDGYESVSTEEKVPHEVIDVPAHYECSCGETHQ